MTSVTDTTTTVVKGNACFRENGITAKRLCQQVNDKITADVTQLLILPPIMPVGGEGEGARGARAARSARSARGGARAYPVVPTAEGFDNVQVAFRVQEFDKSSDVHDKCDTCKVHFDFVLDNCDATVINVADFPRFSFDNPQFASIMATLKDAFQPMVVRCTKSFPVACCCGGGCGYGGSGGSGAASSGVDYVEYGLTVCYQVVELPLANGVDTSFFLYYAVDVQRLSGQHYRAIDGKNAATPGLQGFSRSGVVELFSGQPIVPVVVEDDEECEHPKPVYDWHEPTCKNYAKKCDDHDKHPCGECKPKKIDPCDCPFPARKITWKPLSRFRLRTDEPAWVCGVSCKCPMTQSGTASNCKQRCCACKYVCISASGQRAVTNVPDEIPV